MNQKSKYWWLVLLKGIVLIILGVYIFQHPVSALIGIALYIGITLLFTGIFMIINALAERGEAWGWRLVEGILDILFALVLISNPEVTASIFPFVVGFWMIFYGIMVFVNGFQLRKEGVSNWWMNLISGVLAVIVGYFISTDLLAGAVAVTFWLGLGFLIFGIINVVISFRVKKGTVTE